MITKIISVISVRKYLFICTKVVTIIIGIITSKQACYNFPELLFFLTLIFFNPETLKILIMNRKKCTANSLVAARMRLWLQG